MNQHDILTNAERARAVANAERERVLNLGLIESIGYISLPSGTLKAGDLVRLEFRYSPEMIGVEVHYKDTGIITYPTQNGPSPDRRYGGDYES